MIDRVHLVGDALVGSMDRFRDPVAFVYTVLDYLVVAFGVEGGITAQLASRKTPDSDEKQDWCVSTYPPGYECTYETKPVTIGKVCFKICGQNSFDTDSVFNSLNTLKRWFNCEYPLFPEFMAQQFWKASQCWTGGQIPYSDFGLSELAPKVLKPICDSLKQRMQSYQSGYMKLSIALIYASGNGKMKVRQAVHGGPRTDNTEVPEAVFLACATGFTQWSSSVERQFTIAVPCMVGGFPWAVVYMDCPSPSWLHGYHLYRDVLPRLFEDIRSQAWSSYLDELIKATDAVFGSDNANTQLLNKRWGALSLVFPFSVPQFPDMNVVENGGVDAFSKRLHDTSVSLTPKPNQFFPSIIGNDTNQTWGDIADVVPVLKSAITSRLNVSDKSKENLAQDIAHEFKNLTQNLALKATTLHQRLKSLDTECKQTQNLAKSVAIYGMQLNPVSLALYELASPDAVKRFEPSEDAISLLQAALRVMLELRAISEDGFEVVDDLNFDDAVELLRNTYGRQGKYAYRHRGDTIAELGDLIELQPVVFLLFAASEPVRNVCINKPLESSSVPIKAWTGVCHKTGETILFQESVESSHTPEALPSNGAKRTNKLLPETFCYIEPDVVPCDPNDNFTPANDSANGIVVRRKTRIKVFGRPII